MSMAACATRRGSSTLSTNSSAKLQPLAGAVYRPSSESVPQVGGGLGSPGLASLRKRQRTDASMAPVTMAVKANDSPGLRLARPGQTATEMSGNTRTVASATLVGSATLVAATCQVA